MPEPEDKAASQRFMGMIQYVTKFIPNLSAEIINLWKQQWRNHFITFLAVKYEDLSVK